MICPHFLFFKSCGEPCLKNIFKILLFLTTGLLFLPTGILFLTTGLLFQPAYH